MNSLPNRTTISLPHFILTSNVDSSDVEITTLEEQQDKQYIDQECIGTEDGSTALEYEVLTDEFAVESNDATTIEQVETNLPTNRKPAQWSRYTIYYLIGSYKHLAREEACGKTNFGTTTIWTKVSRNLNRRGFTFTPEQCRTKWLLLKKLYQHIRTEEQLQKFEFIEAIHDYYKNPRVERLLEEIRKTNQVPPRSRRNKVRSKRTLSNTESETKKDDLTSKLETDECEATSSTGFEYYSSHCEPLVTAQDDAESETFKLEIEANNITDVSDAEMELEGEDLETLNENQEDISSDHQTLLVGEHSNFIDEFKKSVEMQEQRRDERHKEKLHLFRIYNERLLTQQEKALMLHKQLMERLIGEL